MKRYTWILAFMAIAVISAALVFSGCSNSSGPNTKYYEVTVSPSENGKVMANPTKAEEGTTITLTVESDPDYELDTLTVTGLTPTKDGDATYTFEMPANDVTVTATFASTGAPPGTFTVTVTPPTGGTITASPTSGASGTSITLTITPAANYDLASLTVGGTEVTATPTETGYTYTFNLTANVTVTGTFTSTGAPPGTFTVTVTPPTNGTITASPTSGASGTSIILTITPELGYDLASLTVGGTEVTATPTANGYTHTFNLTTNVTVAGTFTPINYDISVASGFESNFAANTPTTAIYGATVNLTVTAPSADEKVSTVTVTGGSTPIQAVQGDGASWTFTMPAANVTLSATFETLTGEAYAITKDAPIVNGSIDIDLETARAEAVVTVTATPAPGYRVDAVTVTQTDGMGTVIPALSAINEYTFTMPAYAVTVSVTFVPLSADITINIDNYPNPNIDLTGTTTVVKGTSITFTTTEDVIAWYVNGVKDAEDGNELTVATDGLIIGQHKVTLIVYDNGYYSKEVTFTVTR